jgi:tetratricopeptide (TPR) repeat protein
VFSFQKLPILLNLQGHSFRFVAGFLFLAAWFGGGVSGCANIATGDAHVVRGLEAFNRTDYELAITELEKALEVGISDYAAEEVYTVLGRSYQANNQYQKAIFAHQQAVSINPNYFQAWVNLGIAHRLAGDLNKAEESYNRALAIEPNYAELHASLGALYIFRREPEKAISALDKAISLNNQLAVAHANLAVAYAMLGRFSLAEQELERATSLGYTNSQIIRARIDALKAMQE